jgi:hypothetical protein
VYGQYFPAGTVTIWFLQNGKPAKQVGTVAVGSDGKFKVTITIPKTAVLGQAYIRACLNNTSGPCAYAQITVAL